MKTTLSAVIVMAGLLAMGGCAPPEKKQTVETAPRAVQVVTIASRDLPVVVQSAGRLAPNREVVISAQVPGILMRYNADVGDKVSAGAPLVELDTADYTLALDEAEANLLAARVKLSAAKNTFERASRLLPDKAITPELYDQTEAQYKSSKALVAQLKSRVALERRRLDKTRITAPFDGYVTQRPVEIGQNVTIGDPMMCVADMKTMRVKIYISEMDYMHLDKSDPVAVTVDALSQKELAGRVDKIGIQADSRTNTFEIEILVDNRDFSLKAGLTARVTIRTEVIADAVMIAQNSVIFRENKKEVFIVENDLAAARQVKLGRVDGSQVRILEGLVPGDKLVIAGGQYLKPGDTVVVTP
ncbi:MAG: efflux RND transporter periplasmic adaptor subunit [Desulfobacteraceae bacterium]|jgi:RND family efflux transporter MFP subunit